MEYLEYAKFIVMPYMIWDGDGKVIINKDTTQIQTSSKVIDLYTINNSPHTIEKGFKMAINTPFAISTNSETQMDDLEDILSKAKK